MTHLRRFALLLGAACVPLVPGVLAQRGVTAVLPNGREIHPAGNWIPLAPYPFALAVRPDGAQIAGSSIGFPFALNVIDNPTGDAPQVTRMPSGHENDPAIETHAGLVYARDGALLYVATGDSGKIRAYRTSDWKPAGEVLLDGPIAGKDFSGSFAATVIVSADGKTLYALDQGNWRIVFIDAVRMERIGWIETGASPFGLALSPDGERLYVTNTGLFEYTPIPDASAQDPLHTGLHFPPFGYPSKAAREGTRVEGKQIAGLGNENSDRGSSLWTYDVRDREHPALTAKLRLGDRITEAQGQTVGGAAPTGVAATEDAVYVSLAHEDAVVRISADGSHLMASAALSPLSGTKFQDAQGRPLRGVMPSGLAVEGGQVYVAESGIDAVGVVDAATMQVVRHIPVGWNPSAVAFSPDGTTLFVVNTKGKGTGPNAGKGHDAKMPTYVGSLELGSLSVVSLRDLPSAEESTKAVLAGNTAAIANRPPLPQLKHCFFVIRENRTYDEVLGDVAGANGDPTLARFGMDGWAEEKWGDATHRTTPVGSQTAMHLKVTPNMHALVARFAMSDNFYVDSDVSADGHRWLMGINPTPFFNTAWTSGYGGRRHGSPADAQPGRRALFGGSDAPMPEDEPQFGSLWEHIAASGKGVLNYGEGLEIEGNDEMAGAQPEGQRLFLNAPLPRPVFESTDRRYPTFNLGIPDQFRVAEFERDFKLKLAAGKVPALIVIRLPNDHTMEPRPGDGYPYRASYVADNDLALGRIVSFLSKTPVWKDSALFVTEDDAQSGVDHVDAHRSILLVASPWVKPGTVSHEHTSMGSITRTMDELLGLGALNLEDALAGEMTGIFDTEPHLAPYAAQRADPRVFVAAKARFAKPKTRREAAALRDVDDSDAIRKEMEKSEGDLHRPTSDN
ncbi:MAG: bifunctional YncE family protein/alkaline phosphatase family protein [Terracidiphilus sp.]